MLPVTNRKNEITDKSEMFSSMTIQTPIPGCTKSEHKITFWAVSDRTQLLKQLGETLDCKQQTGPQNEPSTWCRSNISGATRICSWLRHLNSGRCCSCGPQPRTHTSGNMPVIAYLKTSSENGVSEYKGRLYNWSKTQAVSAMQKRSLAFSTRPT